MDFWRGTRPPLCVHPARHYIVAGTTAGRRHFEDHATEDCHSQWHRYRQPHYHCNQLRFAQPAGDCNCHHYSLCHCQLCHHQLCLLHATSHQRGNLRETALISLPTFSDEHLKFNAFWQAFAVSFISLNILATLNVSGTLTSLFNHTSESVFSRNRCSQVWYNYYAHYN